MTIKKDYIISAALQLFSSNGFANTSTSKVAKMAGVSEGLIFRHFKNKEGLLDAIMELGNEKASVIFQPITLISDDLKKLEFILQIPFQIPKEDHAFWKLMYSLKWQADEYNQEMAEQIKAILIQIFTNLNYSNPSLEADLVMMLFDGIATAVLLKDLKNQQQLQELIFEKYNIR